MNGMTWGWALTMVAVGGALGAVVRHLVTLPPLGPFRGVLLVNVLGSLVLGALVAVADQLAPGLYLVLATGVCGAMTTWSTLAVQTWELGRRSRRQAAAYLTLTLLVGLAAASLSYGVLSWAVRLPT